MKKYRWWRVYAYRWYELSEGLRHHTEDCWTVISLRYDDDDGRYHVVFGLE